MLLYGGGPATESRMDGIEVPLPSGPDAPQAVRGALEDALTGWGWDHRREEAVLCASELVTVALEAGYGHLELVARHSGEHLTVELRCTEGACRFSDVLRDGRNRRGVGVVDGLASIWGVRPLGDGDALWFELR